MRELVADLVAEGVGRRSRRPCGKPSTRCAACSAAAARPPGIARLRSEVARELRIDRSAASRRINAAVDRGYLRNLEEKQGRPGRIAPGEPLPDDVAILPTVEDLCGCAGVRPGMHSPPPAPAHRPDGSTNGRADQAAPRCDMCGHRLPAGARATDEECEELLNQGRAT